MLFFFEAMLVLYFAQFVILPIIICFTVKTAANPQFTTFDLAKPPIPLPSSYRQNIPVLESMGFELVAHVYSDTLSSRVRVALTVFVNRLEKDIAVVTHILAETPPAREASFGRVALDKSGEWFRPTLKGAFYNTVMFVWPVGKLRRALERRRGVRLVGGALGHATF